MPYKDPQKKLEWERQHRPERLARRRELRQIEATWKAAHPEAPRMPGTASVFLLPLAFGGVLSAYDPKLAISAGVLTLLVAAGFKRDWRWWIVGTIILSVGLATLWINQKSKSDPAA
jgi:hypothetical protein